LKPNFSFNSLQNTSASDVSSIFEAFAALNVLIVGDVMTDRYEHGKVNRISPEAPVPVVDLSHAENRLGGAANVALNIKALGATPYLFSTIGKDEEGEIFLNLLHQYELSTQGILQSANRKTTVKTRIMAQGQQLLRLDSETVADLTAEDSDVFLKNFFRFIESKTIHVVIFQDYNKGVLTKTVIHQILEAAGQKNIPTTVDPKFKNFFEYKGATLFKPNLKEIRAAVPFSVTTNLESLDAASAYLQQQMGNANTMITLSEHGAYISFLEKDSKNDFLPPFGGIEGRNTGGGAFLSRQSAIVPTEAKNIADVSGAGDTVISVASLGIALGLPMQLTTMLANAAGGQVCESLGVVPVQAERLRRDFIAKHAI
jgi:rfaE bifunctional protein kinase chain/domain